MPTQLILSTVIQAFFWARLTLQFLQNHIRTRERKATSKIWFRRQMTRFQMPWIKRKHFWISRRKSRSRGRTLGRTRRENKTPVRWLSSRWSRKSKPKTKRCKLRPNRTSRPSKNWRTRWIELRLIFRPSWPKRKRKSESSSKDSIAVVAPWTN